jgi:putative transposase
MRKDVAFACQQFEVSERRACKLLGMDRGSYRYEPRPDRNGQLREALVSLARQKPRYGYRRLHALLVLEILSYDWLKQSRQVINSPLIA